MKKLIQLFALSLLGLLVITSCSKENVYDLPTETDLIETKTAQPALPDLVVTGFTSSLPVTNGPCPGPPKANATCQGGVAPQFTFTATISNLTNIAIPANVPIELDWCLLGGGCSMQTITGGLAGMGSITVTSTIFSLPCPGGPPPYQLVEQHFYAVADPNGSINEFRENNNISNRHIVCDDL